MTTITDVEYFFQLRFVDIIHYSLALVSLFSSLDQEVLVSSNNATYICQHGGIDALTVVDIKSISAVVAMVPDYCVTAEGAIITPDNMFSLVDALFLKLGTLCGKTMMVLMILTTLFNNIHFLCLPTTAAT